MLVTRRVAAVLLAAALPMGLAACDGSQVGAAAVVGGERITVSEIQAEAKAIAELAGTEPTEDQREQQATILQSEIRHRVLAYVVDEVGISVPPARVDDLIGAQYLGPNPEIELTDLLVNFSLTEEGFRTAIHDQLVFDELVAVVGDVEPALAMLEAAADELGVEVNPRYGEWVGLGLNPVSGSISEPAEVPDPFDLG